ncbi:unnamed protein product [Adineta steineri]|uniref:Uncharacterized protein n=3 Tax=Adineta steineri TaxID=433720 RepID=A0A813TI95_9BILA|nr:unnamed protein product [Adineta steineri]
MTYLLLYFIFLHLILAVPQINLYYTDSINLHDDDDSGLQHNCLHTITLLEQSDTNHHIVSYCMNESSSKFNIELNHFSSKYTFDQLAKQNITSQQLYMWSAPIDIIEHYQFYLDQLLISNDQSMAREMFYNCTIPRFGPVCQYEYPYYHPNTSSLYEIINHFYSNYEYIPTTLTCYTHLKCDRGPHPACLDWTDICNGHIDCLDGDFDEQHCWQLEINECQDHEYRCSNGECIPQSFYKDSGSNWDCTDMSDELPIFLLPYHHCNTNDMSFKCEDFMCVLNPLTSSCIEQRHELLLYGMFSTKQNTISDECWSAFKCIIPMPFQTDVICNDFCRNDQCIEIIQRTCPHMIYIPATPVFHDIYFVYEKNDSIALNNGISHHPYICYNNHSHYNNYFILGSKISFNNKICYRNNDQPLSSQETYSLDRDYLIKLYRFIWSYDLIYNYTSTICNRSNMYQCLNSLKCISIHRLNNTINDCPQGDDEKLVGTTNINTLEALMEIDNWVNDADEIKLRYARNTISFQTICDGFTELFPIIINGQNETDETQCQQWQCDNIYTRCNYLWNCFDGADEINCDSSSTLLQCSSNQHRCVSPHTNQLICLPITKANDGFIDCLGATDEPTLCRTEYTTIEEHRNTFHCLNQNNMSTCISSHTLCNNEQNCYYGDDEQFCQKNGTFITHPHICSSSDLSKGSPIEQFLCKTMKIQQKELIVYFSLNRSNQNLIEDTPTSSSVFEESHPYQSHCHHGFDLYVWTDNKTKQTICLCPPTFYGNTCQYQNQRVNLVIKFQALSDSWQTPFIIIISLIDDSYERTIHSFQQITYLSMKHCNIKYNLYLLYSTRPKNSTRNYSIHIDIYEKLSLTYRGSLLFPIHYPFLPVHRLVHIAYIPRIVDDTTIQTCSHHHHQCIHGKCINYANNNDYHEKKSFCQCHQGWSGKHCTIPYNCTCSSQSLCLGISAANHRSICICPVNKFGPRCLIDTICQSAHEENNNSTICQNNGRCIPTDEYISFKQTFSCICPKGFSGDRCEIEDNQLILSFTKDILLSQSIFIHFIQIIKNAPPIQATTFTTIPIKQDSILIQWSQTFHLVFIELFNKNYYLTLVQQTYQPSTTIIKTINPSDRCPHISEVFNETFAQLHLLHRIKSYHLPCQDYSLNVSCFYDDIHLCLCYNHDEKRRLANCFEFNHSMTFDCLGQSECENNGECFQDARDCPHRSMCVCRPCFYGRRCQFSTSGFGLSLDAILGYHILPHKININYQSNIIKFSMALTIIFVIIGLINGFLALITFKNKTVLEVGCGLYLFTLSITSLCTISMFGFKFLFLLLTQMTLISNRSFLSFQCHSIDFILRISLTMDQWLNACIALERVIIASKGMRFDKKKSQQAAKIVIFTLLFIIITTLIHDPIHRRLIIEENYDDDEKRIWCIVTYSSSLQIFNSFLYIFHFFGPFLINLVSTIILIINKSRQRSAMDTHQNYRQTLRQQFQQHRNLLTAPILLILLALPRLIIAFISKCMQSANDSWLFLIGYFISFIPSMLTFVIFILPSTFYIKHFRQTVSPLYQMTIQRRLQRNT